MRVLKNKPFGSEYALWPKWPISKRWYIRLFGIVDLPSRLRANAILREINKLNWETLVDLGCGTGAYSFYLSRRTDKKVLGIDINESIIEECQLAACRLGRNNLRFIANNCCGKDKNIATGSVDLILAVEILQYFPDIKSSLDWIHRLLRPEGYLIGHVPMLGYLREYEKTLFSDELISRLLEETGFEIRLFRRRHGGVVRILCNIFGKISKHEWLTAIGFPFLLLASKFFGAETRGDYCLFVAQKPKANI